MIIEFTGLPGSGKSRVENLLMTSLIEKGCFVQDRHELRRKGAMTRSTSGVDQNLWVRKTRTALRWLSFISKTFNTYPEFLIGTRRNTMHLILSAVRVFEDYDLINWNVGSYRDPAILNLSEGLYHHLVALNVWRGYYKRQTACHVPELISSRLPTAKRLVLIKTVLDPKIAKDRLGIRGKPNSWPTNCEIDPVINKFGYYGRLLCDTSLAECYETFTIDTTGNLPSLIGEVRKISDQIIERYNGST